MEELDIEFYDGFMRELLDHIEKEEESKKAIKGCSGFHYRLMKMEETIKPFEGKLEAFLDFLEEGWGWTVSYDKEAGKIIADENRPRCICPMARIKDISPTLCFCSEGLAERMFEKVLGRKVQAKVINSVLRGDASCVYEILI